MKKDTSWLSFHVIIIIKYAYAFVMQESESVIMLYV